MKTAFDNFIEREDPLSFEICDGCQLSMGLEKMHPEMDFFKNLFVVN